MIRKKLITRVVAFMLAIIILLAPGTTVSAEKAAPGASAGSSSSSDLTDLLSAVKYDEYFVKYDAVADNATQTVTLTCDDLLLFVESMTDAYSAYLTSSNGEYIVDENGEKIAKYVPTEADVKVEGQVPIVKIIDDKKCVFLPSEGTVTWKVNLPETALYAIDMVYYAYDGADSKTTGIERTMYINGKVPFYEARFLALTKTWVDDPSTYELDENGKPVMTKDNDGKEVPQFKQDANDNEIKPSKIQASEWRTYSFSDSTGYHADPLSFYFEKGESTVGLEAQREAFYVSSITFKPSKEVISYEDYLAKYKDAKDYSGDRIKLQAEYPTATSEITIYATNDRSSAITQPQDAAKLLLNSLGGDGGEKWLTVGQWVRYDIEVPESGFYTIALRFKQSVLEGSFSSRTLKVRLAGEDEATVPFSEARFLQFNYNDNWQLKRLSDGTTTFKIYLEKGVNSIEFEASFGNMTDILSRVGTTLQIVNDIYIKLLSITGATPDENRDYGFYDIMPDDIDNLLFQSEELYDIAKEFRKVVGTAGSHAKTLETIARLLKKMGKDESKIARNMTNLKDNLGTLGTWLQNSMQQPLQLDYIVIQAPDAKLGKANENFFQSLWYEISQFFQSFFTDYNSLGATEKVSDENVVEVWTTLGRDQAQIIRNLITNEFNAEYEGKSVVLKLVAGGSLLPSVLANVGPDVSLGHAAGDVINWAIRSAVVPLNDIEDQKSFNEVLSWFSESALVPLTLQELYWADDVDKDTYNSAYKFTDADLASYKKYVAEGGTKSLAEYAYGVAKSEHQNSWVVFSEFDKGLQKDAEYAYTRTVYGLPETQGFAMMFYRADVLLDLGIDPPKTWEELIAIIPVLQNNHMEIILPTSLGGLNMFLYQMGGDLYADDGRRIGLDTDVALTAFDYLCQFFQQYSFPVTYSFVNRFRSGETPIGIMDYTTYTQLSVYATEIKGLWEFVALPAYVSADPVTGEVVSRNNTSVSGVSAEIMLVDESRSDELTEFAWEFMKWYVCEETQISYANELTALLGSVSKHNTANINALESLPWTTNEYNNLMSQFENLSAVSEHPGGYIIGRYVNFAFLAVVNDNANAIDSIQDYIVEINKEITRKRQEFGMAYYEISYSTSFTEEKAD